MNITYKQLNDNINSTLVGCRNLIKEYQQQLLYCPSAETLVEKVDVLSGLIRDIERAMENNDRKFTICLINLLVQTFISFEADQFDASDTIFN